MTQTNRLFSVKLDDREDQLNWSDLVSLRRLELNHVNPDEIKSILSSLPSVTKSLLLNSLVIKYSQECAGELNLACHLFVALPSLVNCVFDFAHFMDFGITTRTMTHLQRLTIICHMKNLFQLVPITPAIKYLNAKLYNLEPVSLTYDTASNTVTKWSSLTCLSLNMMVGVPLELMFSLLNLTPAVVQFRLFGATSDLNYLDGKLWENVFTTNTLCLRHLTLGIDVVNVKPEQQFNEEQMLLKYQTEVYRERKFLAVFAIKGGEIQLRGFTN
ncbi:unnamed protein product [Didymodactylos carnosus]|uniref:Uncharacterized protein n=1 Tax=Didymodactylos carnosus TaxID=1234261 RepID=A0A814D3C8_9BILA|nr:unnamed protein product [Didymodactylos carnosus]CAF0949719.1 unnamed protein product [Didymodactylos carnosus]CAF3595342.1 unnamed protein product [Didymodactylos carnosus]CAF3725464.1 unnamed protein product [Didymodactylos carnosus]